MKLFRKLFILIKKYLLPRRWLFLDDIRQPPLHLDRIFDVVRNYDEFVEYIETYGVPEVISMDHDLHQEHSTYFWDNGGFREPPDPMYVNFKFKTGYDCAKWLIDYCEITGQKLNNVIVHSHNPKGKTNIYNLISDYQMREYKQINCRIMSWKNIS